MKILIATKETKKEFFIRQYGIRGIGRACCEQEQDKNRVLEEHKLHHKNLKRLIKAFNTCQLTPDVKARVDTQTYPSYSTKDFRDADIIVSFGGDGEVLDIARHITQKTMGKKSPLIWTEKADPSSIGALAVTEDISYSDKVKRLLEKNYKIKKWCRAVGKISGANGMVASDLALNDIYFGDLYSMGMSRYTIKVRGYKEYQMSSGGIISTQVGLSGWLINIPFRDLYEELPPRNLESPRLDFKIREPSKLTRNGNLLRGFVDAGEKITITSAMNYDGVVAFDGSKPHYKGSRCYNFNRGQILEVQSSQDPLRVIRFK